MGSLETLRRGRACRAIFLAFLLFFDKLTSALDGLICHECPQIISLRSPDVSPRGAVVLVSKPRTLSANGRRWLTAGVERGILPLSSCRLPHSMPDEFYPGVVIDLRHVHRSYRDCGERHASARYGRPKRPSGKGNIPQTACGDSVSLVVRPPLRSDVDRHHSL